MTITEALDVLASARGTFDVSKTDGGLRVHYTGSDSVEEARIFEAVMAVSRWVAKSVGGDDAEVVLRALETDAVHVSADTKETPSEGR